MNPPRILVPLAPGFEEIEAIVPIDLWRRAGFNVTSAGLVAGPITASRHTQHLPDTLLSTVLDQPFELIYLPGGRPGADHLRDCKPLLHRLCLQSESGLRLAAICAAPLALDAAGLLHNRTWTGHPTIRKDIRAGTCSGSLLEIDRNLVTGQSAGVAAELALTLIHELADWATVLKVQEGYLASPAVLESIPAPSPPP
ncbi:MAG: DJ-1/PfpI family protein [Candidatus Methylacidiphilales bacterium]